MFLFRFVLYNFPDNISQLISIFFEHQALADIPKPYNRMLTLVRGQKWKDIRSILTPTFSASKIKQVSILLQENNWTLYRKWGRSHFRQQPGGESDSLTPFRFKMSAT